jgi:RNA-directed DNA polymerase
VPKLDSLKNAKSLSDLAVLLGFTPSGLAYHLYKVPPDQKYAKFEIPKKSGGVRQISAPRGAIIMLQHNLADLLYDCRAEIEDKYRRRPISYGFRRSLSIIDNAGLHRNRRFVLNLDIEDFFPSVNFGRVRGFFIKDHDFALPEKVATVIAQIACFENALPQGSPCSPIIADMLAHILDVRLVRLAKAHRATYSRYADDLTFSTNQKAFPLALAVSATASGSEWTLGTELVGVIERSGFRVNASKTRMQVRASRQMVTGLTVNTKVNIPQDYWRSVRAMCNSLFQTGAYHSRQPVPGASQNASAYKMTESLHPIEGMLSHIYHVKRTAEVTAHSNRSVKQTPSAHLYSKLLFYKYFVALQKPLIVCEGKTDNIYLKYAIRHLTNFHPQLGEITTNGFKTNVSLFNYNSRRAYQILDLTGGASNLHVFINRFRASLARYKHRPLRHPVIILIDNDNGLSSTFQADLKRLFGVDVALTSGDPYYYLTDNLFLVKTPEQGTKGTSCIEDCFDQAIKATKLEGKTFKPDGKLDPATEYGKAVFAEKVVVPKAAEIAWDGFEPLLTRVAGAINHYSIPMTARTRRSAMK